jgi:cytoskeletal protein RodZ
MPEIGATLREARMRARIDISEIEAGTKIRAKYLRALENEEWGLLPGPAYVRSFLRTYAEALDLDAKLLLEEYKLRHERPSDHDLIPIGSPRRRGGGRSGPVRHHEPRRIPRGVVVGVVVLLLLGALYLLGSKNGGGSGGGSAAGNTRTSRTTTTPVPAPAKKSPAPSSSSSSSSKRSAASRLVRLQVIATGPGPVSACLVDAAGKVRIPGATLQQNVTAGPYRSKAFRLKLGNGHARVRVDGKIRDVPNVSPVAFTITRKSFTRVDATTVPNCAG